MPKAKKENVLFWLGLYLVMILRYFYYGIKYFPVADDFNQFGVYYRRSSDIWNNVILYYNRYTNRPLAFLSDAYVTMRFWRNMWAMLLLYVTLHFLSCYFIHASLKKSGLKLGMIGITVFALCPGLYEAAYWLSASTRLVAGVFFAAASVYSFTLFVEKLTSGKTSETKKTGGYFTSYIICGLLSMGFYEQTAVFSIALTFIILFLNRKKLPKFSKICSFAVPILNLLIIGAYYLYFMFINTSAVSQSVDNRAQLIGFKEFFPLAAEMTTKIVELLTKDQIVLTVYSFFRGLGLIISIRGIIITAAVVMLCVYLYKWLKKGSLSVEFESDGLKKRIIVGLILTAAPFLVFYVLKGSYIDPRAAFPSFVGIAVLFDAAFDSIKKIKAIDYKRVKQIAVPVLTVVFFIATVSIVNTYKKTSETDMKLASGFLTVFENSSHEYKELEIQKQPIAIYNIKPQYTGIKYPFMYNCIEAGWRFQGVLNAVSEKNSFTNIEPVKDGGNYLGTSPMFGVDEKLNFFELEEDVDGKVLYVKGTDLRFGEVVDGKFYKK